MGRDPHRIRPLCYECTMTLPARDAELRTTLSILEQRVDAWCATQAKAR